ncbi:MAG: hypothetical protein KGH98_04700 [Candidatus Micrarchaeota archaeon]|nr:hypothetical protein [Candidatus Micrarchaeota archaeon]
MALMHTSYKKIRKTVSEISTVPGLGVVELSDRLGISRDLALLRVCDMMDAGLVYYNGKGDGMISINLSEAGFKFNRINTNLPGVSNLDPLKFSTVGTCVKIIAENPGILAGSVAEKMRGHEPNVADPARALFRAAIATKVKPSDGHANGSRDKACFITMDGRELYEVYSSLKV